MEGKHIIIDAFECDAVYLNDITYLEKLCNETALNTDMEVLYTYFHQFQPQGVTGMLVLSTSHISIHTWPEEGYASLDFYTCGDHDLNSQIKFLLQGLSSKNAMVYSFSRGVSYPQIIQCKNIRFNDTMLDDNTDLQQE
ncbi:adenosylmethionine decarboxylase [Fredinandcohnia sp. FSL W7-1320]|uniref:adenosylmethionine decarboxylase n=1 Tax=Fredinandcohnia sp. FSL W7-1320 TaxID=2954540 RepID=UPI0030FDABCD